jgi:hypothetical protein
MFVIVVCVLVCSRCSVVWWNRQRSIPLSTVLGPPSAQWSRCWPVLRTGWSFFRKLPTSRARLELVPAEVCEGVVSPLPGRPRVVRARWGHEGVQQGFESFTRNVGEPAVDPAHPTDRLRQRRATPLHLGFEVDLSGPSTDCRQYSTGLPVSAMERPSTMSTSRSSASR